MIFVVTIFVASVVSLSIIPITSNHDAQELIYGIKLVKADDNNQLNGNTNALVKTIGKAKYVSIVQDAAYVGSRAFSPNPINNKVVGIVTWTNDDIETHTVTSGLSFNDFDFGKKFDSGIMGYKQTFSHKFTTAGELDYFCQFHPMMIGKVIVR
jgi:plastocyanin